MMFLTDIRLEIVCTPVLYSSPVKFPLKEGLDELDEIPFAWTSHRSEGTELVLNKGTSQVTTTYV